MSYLARQAAGASLSQVYQALIPLRKKFMTMIFKKQAASKWKIGR